MNNSNTFRDWLLEKLDEKDWTQSDLARAARIGRSSISEVISGRRQVGRELATAIASALKIPPEDVFRVAGLLPPNLDNDEWDRRIQHLLTLFPTEEASEKIRRIELDEQTKQNQLDRLEHARQERDDFRSLTAEMANYSEEEICAWIGNDDPALVNRMLSMLCKTIWLSPEHTIELEWRE